MNTGKLLGLGIGSVLLVLASCAGIPASAEETRIQWKQLDSNRWVKPIGDVWGKSMLTLERDGTMFQYSVTLPCPLDNRTFTLSWKHGSLLAEIQYGCDGKPGFFSTDGLLDFFKPFPPEVTPPSKPAEIFINPERPQIVA